MAEPPADPADPAVPARLPAPRRPGGSPGGRPKGRKGPYPSDRHTGFTPELAAAIAARVAEGHTLAGVSREPGLPRLPTLREWMRKHRDFARQVREARAEWARRAAERHPGYCVAAAEIIFERLCNGEGLVNICRDDTLPTHSCVYRWIRDVEAFRAMVELARRIQADRLAELGWEIAREATPEGAPAAEVKLRQLRWSAARIAPRIYGALRPAGPRAGAPDAEGGA